MISPTTKVSLAALTACALVGTAYAGANDYAFEPVQSQVQKGEGVTVAVRLIEKSSKKPVPDAVIIGSRLDMAPDQMPTMVAPLSLMPGNEPGIYRFKTDLVMAGRWLLSIAAKVQGEPETVVGKVTYTVTP
jgi:YtkA-like